MPLQHRHALWLLLTLCSIGLLRVADSENAGNGGAGRPKVPVLPFGKRHSAAPMKRPRSPELLMDVEAVARLCDWPQWAGKEFRGTLAVCYRYLELNESSYLRPAAQLQLQPVDPSQPLIFHIIWRGELTNHKLQLVMNSFLYTQPRLQELRAQPVQLWVWLTDVGVEEGGQGAGRNGARSRAGAAGTGAKSGLEAGGGSDTEADAAGTEHSFTPVPEERLQLPLSHSALSLLPRQLKCRRWVRYLRWHAPTILSRIPDAAWGPAVQAWLAGGEGQAEEVEDEEGGQEEVAEKAKGRGQGKQQGRQGPGQRQGQGGGAKQQQGQQRQLQASRRAALLRVLTEALERRKDGTARTSQYVATRDYSDIQRVLVLVGYGGLYFDGDMQLLRDLRPLQVAPWWYRWEVYGWPNNAIMFTRPGDPVFLGLLATMAHKCLELDARSPHGLVMKRAPVFVFQRILGAMQAAGRQPPHMLPASLFNAFKWVENKKEEWAFGRWDQATYDSFHRLAHPAAQPENVNAFLRGAFASHFHNQWNVHFGEGTWGMAWQEAYRRFFGGKQANLYGETWDWALCNA